ncbi:hypothetical protein HDU76_011768, partial [Blyttiomyces sp. JEL0837]
MTADSSISHNEALPRPKLNLTIAAFSPYAVGDLYKYTVMTDAEIELVVNETNADPTILPDFVVNVRRFNAFDPAHALDSDLVDSGGYNALQAMNVCSSGGWESIVIANFEYVMNLIGNLEFDLVIGGVGEHYSKSTVFTAQIFSQFKVPFCGVVQGSPALSNKNKYPYYFRMLPGVKGTAVAALFKHWKVKRVALVTGYDALSKA